METLLKVALGVIIGVGASWLMFDMSVTEDSSEHSKKKIAQYVQKDGTELTSHGSHEKEALIEELRSTKQQLEVALATKQAAIEKLRSSEKAHKKSKVTDNGQKGGDANKAGGNKYYDGVPASHQMLLQPAEGKRPYDHHREFYEEKEDIGWSLEKEQQIRSFIQGHALGADILLELVKCKTTICEVYGSSYSQDDEALGVISEEMRSQPWWDFLGSSTSSSSNTTDTGRESLFVLILFKNY